MAGFLLSSLSKIIIQQWGPFCQFGQRLKCMYATTRVLTLIADMSEVYPQVGGYCTVARCSEIALNEKPAKPGLQTLIGPTERWAGRGREGRQGEVNECARWTTR